MVGEHEEEGDENCAIDPCLPIVKRAGRDKEYQVKTEETAGISNAIFFISFVCSSASIAWEIMFPGTKIYSGGEPRGLKKS